ncbi:hypothetical protein CPB86DRAFT_779462, partial [Serendipita vermifera]
MIYSCIPLSSDKLTPAEREDNCPQCLHASHQTFTTNNKTVVDTSQCTDRCIVVACESVENSSTKTGGACNEDGCDALCQSFFGDPSTWICDQEDCNFEELLQCCLNDVSPICDQACTQQYPLNWTWVETFPSIGNHDKNVAHHPYQPYPAHAVPNMMPAQQDTYQHHSHSQMIPHDNHFPLSAGGPACLWGDCHATFPDRATLVQHIQYDHLSHLQSLFSSTNLTAGQQSHVPPNQPHLNALTAPNWSAAQPNARPVACQWGNCSATFAAPNDGSQPSVIQNPSDPDIDMLLAHLFAFHVPQPEEETPTPVLSHTTSHTSSNDSNDTSSIITSPITPTSGEAPDGTLHTCDWADCGQTFTTVDELTDHIAEVHVGHGKSFYDCLWKGCDRHGDNGFPSRQKVLRHIQKHSGYKPYVCNICNEHFAESTSLQQHMRRHTHEKPYVCDFPGCGKAFAVPGGLRIHKRAHYGEKPFKCPEPGCDKAFAESSNLAKH